jgi:DNA polymerase-3 subunit gamma/tau
VPSPPAPAAPGHAPAPAEAPRSSSALDQQARRLADFFNGEVIPFDGPLDELQADELNGGGSQNGDCQNGDSEDGGS